MLDTEHHIHVKDSPGGDDLGEAAVSGGVKRDLNSLPRN